MTKTLATELTATNLTRDKALAYVELGASRNPTHYDTMSGYAVANPTYTLTYSPLSNLIF